MTGIWINERQFVDFKADPRPKELEGEIATRRNAWDFRGDFQFLPNPDPVLMRLADQGEEVLSNLTADAHVISVVQTRKLGTLQREFRFRPGADGERKISVASQTLHQAFLEDLEGIDLTELVSQILDAPFYGMVPLELLWQAQWGRLRLKGVRAVPSHWFRFNSDNEPVFLQRSSFQGLTLPWGKFVFARHFPSYENPYGLRLLSRCLWPVTFKKGGVKFWVMLAEKYGMPLLVGKYPAGTPAQGQEELLASLSRAVRDAVLVLPEGNQVELQESTQGGARVHQELVATMNKEISKAILGQHLTTEVGTTGSYAASKTHLDILGSYLEADQKLVKTVVNQIARIYQKLNDPKAKSPEFYWFEEEDPRTEWVNRDQLLGQMGLVFGEEYFCRQYGLTQGEFTLKTQG
ncbi:MAG: hypothetical protein A2600_06325 [Candidatus Lambdaproteobacteria bacterium RIFOXYD1_FULL_56_27]|uniref:DUF935 domain-containing protein n=1 Tax=Candidatus Lambdaproteobacteria bacterium RIFOXYD2_FULL_56_26 TaxID=1817773 RepID=A0A1F6GLB2_9PROT|nr:MAG: hypothetical protein A2557_12875 [Candidatus Lambdaproteobacteria bacterium RIFOXYD2_FULL_56_26]OGH05502.1 MAG: hypothetical protein A2426_03895 [Candidatus Lambdaproteobacteria bacterium RIFOXYC1_FULL_56_13]OGH09793.1 MAG: hypothetical protein A2600_06325 [Candidatus Lambdaproteobacteria bacterium RIFOXYD1_FULL_56_27]